MEEVLPTVHHRRREGYVPHVFPIVRPGLLPIQSIRRLRRLVRLEGELQGWAGAVASGGAFEAFQFSVAHRRGSRDSWEYFFFFLKRSFIKIDQLLRRKLTWSFFFSLSLYLRISSSINTTYIQMLDGRQILLQQATSNR